MVSEWYDDNVENHIKSGEFVKPRPLSRLACQVLEGLAYLSEHGIAHRTLSPDNILLTPQVTPTYAAFCVCGGGGGRIEGISFWIRSPISADAC